MKYYQCHGFVLKMGNKKQFPNIAMLGYPQFGLLGGASHLVNGSKKQLYIYLISHLIVWNEIWARFMDSTRFPRISTDAHPTMNKKLQCPSTNSNWLVV